MSADTHMSTDDQPEPRYALTFARWRPGEPLIVASGDMSAGHPACGTICPLCSDPVTAGQRWSIVVVGPTDDDDQARHDDGRWYSAGATITHEPCPERLSDEQLAAAMEALQPRDVPGAGS